MKHFFSQYQLVFTVVMKNWQPLELGPKLTMETTPVAHKNGNTSELTEMIRLSKASYSVVQRDDQRDHRRQSVSEREMSLNSEIKQGNGRIKGTRIYQNVNVST